MFGFCIGRAALGPRKWKYLFLPTLKAPKSIYTAWLPGTHVPERNQIGFLQTGFQFCCRHLTIILFLQIPAMPTVLRKTPDPNVAVSELMQVLHDHLKRENTKDLWHTLQVPDNQQLGWKKACNPLWMAKLNFLVHGLILVAPNGVVASVKLKLAIQKLLADHKCTTSKGHEVNDTVDLCDQMIRVLLGQFRACKDKQEKYYRVCRRMSAAEKSELDKTLAAMDSNIEQEPGSSIGGSAEHRLVVWQPPKAPAVGTGSDSIIKKILAKQDSDTSAEQSRMLSLPSSSSRPLEGMPSSGSRPFLGMVAGETWSPSELSSVAPTSAKKQKTMKNAQQKIFYLLQKKLWRQFWE